MRGVRVSLLARAGTLPIAALAALFATRVVVDRYGADQFALYALVVGLALIVPLGDLGVGAALTDCVARRDEIGRQQLLGSILTSFRTIAGSTIVVIVIALVGGSMGLWSRILGTGADQEANLAATSALIAFALALLPASANRILIGAHKNHVAILFQTVAALIGLAWVVVVASFSGALWVLVLGQSFGIICSGTAALHYANRTLKLPVIEALSLVHRTSVRGVRVRHLAGPMMLIGIVLPIALQSDRLVLSWVTSLGEVAQYSLAYPVFAACFTLVGTSSASLWAVFAQRRTGDMVTRAAFLRIELSFLVGGSILGLALVVFGPFLTDFMGAGDVTVPMSILWAFAALLVAFSVWSPMGMLLTSAVDLRFQAVLHVAMAAVNLGLSIALALVLGPAGPPLASALAVALVLVLPGAFRARRRVA